VDGNAGDLGEFFLDQVFESDENVVDAGNGVIAFHDAVAGGEDVVLDLADTDIVAAEELVVATGHVIEAVLDGELELAHFADANFGSGNVAAERLDMDVDVEFAIAVAESSDGVFEFGSLAVSFTEGKIFIDFKVKFDKEIAVLLSGRNVVNGVAHALGDGANGFEEVFVGGSAGFGVDDDVGGDDFADPLFNRVCERVDLFQVCGARDRDGGVDEMAIAGAADADAVDTQDTVHVANGIGDLVLQTFGDGVEKSV
jgi:hypothetical protein